MNNYKFLKKEFNRLVDVVNHNADVVNNNYKTTKKQAKHILVLELAVGYLLWKQYKCT